MGRIDRIKHGGYISEGAAGGGIESCGREKGERGEGRESEEKRREEERGRERRRGKE